MAARAKAETAGDAKKAKAERVEKAPAAPKRARRTDGGPSLVIVESPAKAKTIKKYLGRSYDVRASVGHVKDLPKSKMGVDLENGSFEPEYDVIKGKAKVLSDIKRAATTA